MNQNWYNTIFNVDCLEGMKKHIPNKSIDVIVTSPPYNIGINYNSYDDNLPFQDYLAWIEKVTKECKRVLKDDGSFFFNIGDKPSDELRSLKVAEKISNYFTIQNTIHWVKSIAIPELEINIGHYKPVNSVRFLNNSHEYIFHFTKTGDIEINKLAIGVPYRDKSNIGRWKHATDDIRCRGNQWFIPYSTVKKKKIHPAMFPQKLPEMCIALHKMEQHKSLVVLDPFLGVGTTAKAAKKLGCIYVGFEIDKKYFKIAKKSL